MRQRKTPGTLAQPIALLGFSCALLLASGACFETPKPECAFACPQDNDCPDGYRCTTNDGWCKRDDVAESFQCSPASLIDAATFDATIIDADTTDAAVDAAPDAEPDAFDPCPGAVVPFEVGVVDWVTDANLPGITVTEAGTANSVTSAPNGRVVLCIPPTGSVDIEFTDGAYLDRTHTTTGELAAELYAASAAPTFRLLTAAQATTLYTSATATRSATESTVIAMVHQRPNGTDAAGAALTLSATNEGGFTPNAGDVNVLDAGATSLADGRVLFLNTDVSGTTTTVNVTGLTGCTLPPTTTLQADAISSVTILCDP